MNSAVCIAAFELLSSMYIRSFTKDSQSLKLFVVSTAGGMNEVAIEVPVLDCPHPEGVLRLCNTLLKRSCGSEKLSRAEPYLALGRYLLQNVTASVEQEPGSVSDYQVLIKVGPASVINFDRSYPVEHPFEVFRSIGALLSGYTLTDHRVYAEVKTPAGAVREVISGQTCSCGKRSCIHEAFAATYYRNVRAFLDSGVAVLHSS